MRYTHITREEHARLEKDLGKMLNAHKRPGAPVPKKIVTGENWTSGGAMPREFTKLKKTRNPTSK